MDPTTPAPKPKSKLKKVLLIIGGVTAAFAILFFVIFSITQPLVTTANAYFDALAKGEYEKSYQEFFSVETRKLVSLADYVSSTEKISVWTHKKKIIFNNRSISGQTGSLSGTFTTDYGSVVPVSMTFVKENGVWKIFDVRMKSADSN